MRTRPFRPALPRAVALAAFAAATCLRQAAHANDPALGLTFDPSQIAAAEQSRADCDAYRQSLLDAGRIVYRTEAQGGVDDQYVAPYAREKARRITDDPAGEFVISEAPSPGAAGADLDRPEALEPPALFVRRRMPFPYATGEKRIFGCYFIEFEVNERKRAVNRKLLWASSEPFSRLRYRESAEDFIELDFRTFRRPEFAAVAGSGAKLVWEIWHERIDPATLDAQCDAALAALAAEQTERADAVMQVEAIRAQRRDPRIPVLWRDNAPHLSCRVFAFDVDPLGRPFNIVYRAGDRYADAMGGRTIETPPLLGLPPEDEHVRERYFPVLYDLEFEPARDAAGQPVISRGHVARIDRRTSNWKSSIGPLKP